MSRTGIFGTIGGLAVLAGAYFMGAWNGANNPDTAWSMWVERGDPEGRYTIPIPEDVPEIRGRYGVVTVDYDGTSMHALVIDNQGWVPVHRDKAKPGQIKLMRIIDDLNKGTFARTERSLDGKVLDLKGPTYKLVPEAGEAGDDAATITLPPSLRTGDKGDK